MISRYQIKYFSYTPILGWSFTRYETFSICKRRYFYQYYGKYDPEIPTPIIDQYKKLTSIPLKTGEIVHNTIEVLLKRMQQSNADIDRDRFLEYTQKLIYSSLRDAPFEELFYRSVEAITPDDIFPTVQQSLLNLLDSPRFAWLQNEASQRANEWIIEPGGYGEARLNDLKVYFKVDFLLPFEDKIYIFDWKTGQPDAVKHQKQMRGYAAWTVYHFEVDASQVETAIAHLLPEYSEATETFESTDLEHFALQIQAETREMYAYCRDVENNIPRDKEEFPMVADERICSYCRFRGLCFPEKYPPGL